MKTVFDSVFAVIGAFLGFYFGKLDGLLIVLCIFSIIDYLTGIISAIIQKNLSSAIGFKGLMKKMLMFIFVGMANLIDIYLIGSGQVLRSAVIFFYLSNEGLSITENAVEIGLPIPPVLTKFLKKVNEASQNKEISIGDTENANK
ncbi:MAG: phage holin family protein [Clostridia bacterium]|nr:phage holin family protein [Clostridia bacterium]